MSLLSPPIPTTPHTPAPAAPTYEQLLERVRHEGVYATRQQAQDVVRRVLEALGRQLTGEERAELAAHLPRQASAFLASQSPTVTPLTGWSFVQDLAERTGATPATTRWDTGAVLGVVARLAGGDLIDRITAQLPDGYALLFGRAQLTQRV